LTRRIESYDNEDEEVAVNDLYDYVDAAVSLDDERDDIENRSSGEGIVEDFIENINKSSDSDQDDYVDEEEFFALENEEMDMLSRSQNVNNEDYEESDADEYVMDMMPRSPNGVSNYDKFDNEVDVEEDQFVLLEEEINEATMSRGQHSYEEEPQYDSAGYLIGHNPLVSGADYDDLDKEIAEEDAEVMSREHEKFDMNDEYDMGEKLKFDANEKLKFDTNEKLKFDTNEKLKFNTNEEMDRNDEYDMGEKFNMDYDDLDREIAKEDHEEDAEVMSRGQHSYKEEPQYDSAGYLIGQNPLVSGADYDEVDNEVDVEEDQFVVLYSEDEEYDMDEELLMPRSPNGISDYDEFDSEVDVEEDQFVLLDSKDDEEEDADDSVGEYVMDMMPRSPNGVSNDDLYLVLAMESDDEDEFDAE